MKKLATLNINTSKTIAAVKSLFHQFFIMWSTAR